MASPSLSGQFQVGIDILGTIVSAVTRKILAQTGSNTGQGQTDADNVIWMQHVGFASRPAEPEKGKNAAQGFVFRQGGQDVCIASQDLRGLDIYGNLLSGETCLYAVGKDGAAQARVLLKGDGSINFYTRKGNTSGGAGMLIQLDASAGAIRLVNDKGYGIIIDGDGVKITAKGSSLSLGGDGAVSLVGTSKCQIDGTSICLGNGAVPGTNNALCGATGLAGLPSPKVFIGMT